MLKLLTASQIKLQQAQDRLSRQGDDTGDAVQTAAIVAGGVVVAGIVIAAITAFVNNKVGSLG
jgi:hypothetical protein